MDGAKVIFVTGTDTGVGKTVVATLITRHLVKAKVRVMAVKPFCSGGRDDARRLRDALAVRCQLDDVNPWHYRAALTPLLAARRQGDRVTKIECLQFLREAARGSEVLVVEGAGGLLSPLGEGFDALDLIVALGADTIVVGSNRLGAINQLRLVMAALKPAVWGRTRVALMEPEKRSLVSRTNLSLLRELAMPLRVVPVPFARGWEQAGMRRLSRPIWDAVGALVN